MALYLFVRRPGCSRAMPDINYGTLNLPATPKTKTGTHKVPYTGTHKVPYEQTPQNPKINQQWDKKWKSGSLGPIYAEKIIFPFLPSLSGNGKE
eukprot:2423819-Amphidinium_carterae.1